MYAGHFAAALALKARVPKAPTWGLLVGVGLLDILFGPFVLAGIEQASLTPGISPGFSLDHIDWSHSLAMSLVWSGLFGAVFLRRGRTVAAVMAVAVFSHFVLDMVMPEVDGIDLLKRLAHRSCNAQILVISGYNPMYMDAAKNLACGLEMPNVTTLQKPFRVAALEAALAVGH